MNRKNPLLISCCLSVMIFFGFTLWGNDSSFSKYGTIFQGQNKNFNYLGLGSRSKAGGPLTPDDLAETMEVQFTQEIIDLANSLNNSPRKIFQYVRNNIKYQPYYGSLKGSQETLLQKVGNDLDIASLLIALFRSPNVQVPCRYAGSFVKIKVNDVLDWLQVNNIETAIEILNDAGILSTLTDNDTSVQMIHYWVHAYLPFGNYRGREYDMTESVWIPLDASFKKYDIQIGAQYSNEIIFDDTLKDEYYGEVRETHAVDFYLSELQGYLDIQHPGTGIDDLRLVTSVSYEQCKFLPLGFPYWVNYLQLVEGAELTDSYRFQANFHITKEGITVFDHTLKFPENCTKKLTISFGPATATDQSIIDSYGGFYQTPPNEIMVKPALNVDGTTINTGSSLMPGIALKLHVDLTMPGLLSFRAEHDINSGGYYAFSLDHVGFVSHHISERYDVLNNAIQNPHEYYSDEFLGELLYIGAIEYFNELEKASCNIKEVTHHVYNKGWSEIMIGQGVYVEYTDDIPVLLKPTDYFLDVQRHAFDYYPVDASNNRSRELYSIESMTASFYHHWALDNIGELDGISTVKTLQVSVEQGYPLYTIGYYDLNPGGTLEQLAIDQEVKDLITYEIENDYTGTAHDLVVTVPYDEMTYNQWSGTAWTSYDPEMKYETFNLWSETGNYTSGNMDAITTIIESCPEYENCAPNVKIVWPYNKSAYCLDGTVNAWAFYWDMGGVYIPFTLTWTSDIPGSPQGIHTEEYVTTSGDQPGKYKLEVQADNAYGTAHDQIDIYTIEVIIDKCPGSFVPKGGDEDNTVSITARVNPGYATGRFQFELFDVSDEPGYCMNAPQILPPSSDEDSDDWKDLQFPEQEGFLIYNNSGQNDVAVTTSDVLCEATVKIKSFDYGAYGKIRVYFIIEDETGFRWCLGVVVGETNEYVTIPLDEDNNYIHDFSPQNSGPDSTYSELDDNDSEPVGDSNHPGDGLSRYEEYRGFMVSGLFKRTDVTKKDVFVRNMDVVDAGASGYFTTEALGANVNVINNSEWLNEVLRNINFNSNAMMHVYDQTAIKVENGGIDVTQPKNLGVTRFNSPIAVKVPNNVLFCRVYVTSIKKTEAKINKVGVISAGDSIIPVDSTYWYRDELPAIMIDQEFITCVGADENRFYGCSIENNHNNGAEVSRYADPTSVIKWAFAHEAGHTVGLIHEYGNEEEDIMYVPVLFGSMLHWGFWDTFQHSVPGYFKVKE